MPLIAGRMGGLFTESFPFVGQIKAIHQFSDIDLASPNNLRRDTRPHVFLAEQKLKTSSSCAFELEGSINRRFEEYPWPLGRFKLCCSSGSRRSSSISCTLSGGCGSALYFGLFSHLHNRLLELPLILTQGAGGSIGGFSARLGRFPHLLPLTAGVIGVDTDDSKSEDRYAPSRDEHHPFKEVSLDGNRNWLWGICLAIIVWSTGHWLIYFCVRGLYEVVPPKIPKIFGALAGVFLFALGILILHASLDLRYFGIIYPEHLL